MPQLVRDSVTEDQAPLPEGLVQLAVGAEESPLGASGHKAEANVTCWFVLFLILIFRVFFITGRKRG